MFLLQSIPPWFRGIDAVDKWLFFQVNRSSSNALFDQLLPFARESTIWTPLYLFMLALVLLNFRSRAWPWVLFFLCTVGISDMISSHLIKENILRLRPCNDPALLDQVRVLVNYRPQSSSFTSSHACNHFSMAVFMVYTLRSYLGKWTNLLFGWAALVSFAQVYVGVHYPLDVICGGLLGAGIGYLMARFFNNYAGFISLHSKSPE